MWSTPRRSAEHDMVSVLVGLMLIAAPCAWAAPTCSITFPVSGQSYACTALDHFGGTAGSGGGVLDRVEVLLYYAYYQNDVWNYTYWQWDAGAWGPYGAACWTRASGTSNWSVTSKLPPYWWLYGTYCLYARAYNTDGSASGYAYASFGVNSSDTTMPNAAVTYPVQNQWYYPGPDRIAGTASDDLSGVALVECHLAHYDSAAGLWKYWNWQTRGWETSWPTSAGCRALASGTEQWQVTSGFPTWVQGGYWATCAWATDHVGWVRQTGWTFFGTGDNRAPTGAITRPAQDASYFPGLDRIAGVASDDESGVSHVDCELAWYDASTGWWNYWNWGAASWQPAESAACFALASGKANWELTTGFPDPWPCPDWYCVRARVVDNVGNIGYIPWIGFYIREQVPPTVTITTPRNGVWYLPGAATFTGTASDAESGLDALSCYLGCEVEPGAWQYWNWVRRAWEAYDTGHAVEYVNDLPVAGSWEVTSGLPDTWPCCKQYLFGVQATDKCSNYGYAYVYFHIGDNVAPIINSITATPGVLWPPNHKLVDVTVTVNASDNYDPAPVSRITGVTCSEPITNPGDGNKQPDWEITGDLTLRLRAERAGPSTARVYTISVLCTDACGNPTAGTVKVTVPHDQSK